MSRVLNKILEELTVETKNNPPIRISVEKFSTPSNTIIQGQNNTIIKLLIEVLTKVDKLEEKIKRLDHKSISSEYVAWLVKRIEVVESKVEESGKSSVPKVDIGNILGPKVNLRSKNK